MIGLLAQDSAASYDWANEFHPFTPLHWITTGVCLALIAGACILGVLWRATPRELTLRRSWAIFVLIAQVVFVTYYLWPPFDIGYNLPLHICDLAGWLAGFALLTQKRWLRSLLYYWGLILSTQAFIQPVLKTGYANAQFWAFWGLHLMIVGSAVYDLIVLRFRPSWRDFRTAVLITSSYAAVIFVFNWQLRTNYLYIGPDTPENPTIVDYLGEWPWRALWIALMVTAGMAVFTSVWPMNWKRSLSATVPAPPPSVSNP